MDNNKKNEYENRSWLYRWFVDNKFSVGLINIFLFLLIIFLFTKVSYVFAPIGVILKVIMPTLLVSIVMFYLMEPAVDFFETKFKVNRVITTILIFVVVIALFIWGIISFIPFLQSQIASLVDNFPHYWDSMEKFLQQTFNKKSVANSDLQRQLETVINNFGHKIVAQMDKLIPQTVNNLGSAVTVITNVFVVVLTAPFIVFFMLKDKEKFFDSLLTYIPDKLKKSTNELFSEISDQLSSYIVGQITVAFWVGVMFAIGYFVIGLKYGIVLAILAAFCNLIPYIGSALALLPALVIGLFTPGMFIKVVIVFIIEQTLETRLVSPLVVGNKMQMHPVTTIIVLLGAGSLFGVLGVLLGIPLYAILKIIFTKSFVWFQQHSNLYEDTINNEVIENSINEDKKEE